MDDVIFVDKMTVHEKMEPVTFRLRLGALGLIITPTETLCEKIIRVLLGLSSPHGGTLSLFGHPLAEQNERELNKTRMQIGTVFNNGGLISNLKALENVIFPALYHDRHSDGMEQSARDTLRSIGYTGPFMALTGHLDDYQQKLIGMARAMLMNPDLMLYGSLQQTLQANEKMAMVEIVRSFHDKKRGRTSLLLSADPNLPTLIPEAEVFHVKA